MAYRPTVKPTLRQQKEASQKAMDFYADMAGMPRQESLLKPKRAAITNKSDEADLEAAVLREVGALLILHPKVLFAVRQNSGAAFRAGENGRSVPVFFYKIVKCSFPMTVSDYWGMLTDGRMFALECKRRNWVKPGDIREHQQAEFLKTIRSAGGIGEFITGHDQVSKIFAA